MARVLLIDDDPVFLQLLSDTFALRGGAITIETALDAAEALRRLHRTDYDVVISDVRMPGMEGLEFLRRCRDRRPDTLVVLITGYGDPNLEHEAMGSGAYAFIRKPFVADVFFSVIQRAVLRSKLLHRRPHAEGPRDRTNGQPPRTRPPMRVLF